MLIRGYSDVSITRAGVRNDLVCDLNWGAYFKLDTDVRELFPFINGTVENARYYERPLHVRFGHHIFNKISANDRTQAAVWAVKNRIV